MSFSPIKLEIYRGLLTALCEEMGEKLRRVSFSPNIRERQDFSCALFSDKGEMVAQAAHIPVHLGSMGLAVTEAVKGLQSSLRSGDVLITNDPFQGGTHLPDITLISPIFLPGRKRPTFYIATRAHHVDVGGDAPGSMPLSNHISSEGIYIRPTKLVTAGKINQRLITSLAKQVRLPTEFKADLNSQLAANKNGEQRLTDIIHKYGVRELCRYVNHLLDYEERLTRAVIRGIPDGSYSFADQLDDDGFSNEPVHIALQLEISGERAIFDFSASSDETQGPVNATRSIVWTCITYVMRCLMHATLESPTLSLRPISLITKKPSVVDATFPCPVAGGNVETSQRIVDVILGALAQALPKEIPAASCGSMNNIALGGRDPFRKRPFAYYETIGGGMGAAADTPGLSGVHTHMTNTLNTPIEVIEAEHPLRVTEYSLRHGSGGQGRHRGGLGICREFEFLCATEVTLLTERRRQASYGLAGGKAGKPGRNYLVRSGRRRLLPSKVNLRVKTGDRIRMETPGGGGFGKSD